MRFEPHKTTRRWTLGLALASVACASACRDDTPRRSKPTDDVTVAGSNARSDRSVAIATVDAMVADATAAREPRDAGPNAVAAALDAGPRIAPTDDAATVAAVPPDAIEAAAPDSIGPEPSGTFDAERQLQPDEGTLTIAAPGDARAGAPAIARVTVAPKPGFHINLAFPTKLTLESAPGLAIARAELTAGTPPKSKGDAEVFDEQNLTLPIAMTPDHRGRYTVYGTFKFAVCKSDECLIKKEMVAISFAVANR